jgi:hypothetical protein
MDLTSIVSHRGRATVHRQHWCCHWMPTRSRPASVRWPQRPGALSRIRDGPVHDLKSLRIRDGIDRTVETVVVLTAAHHVGRRWTVVASCILIDALPRVAAMIDTLLRAVVRRSLTT